MLARTVELFVCPDGSDQSTGLSRTASGASGPLASVIGALNRVRELRKVEPDAWYVLTLLDGVYKVDGSIGIPSDICGSENSSLILRAETAGSARLIGVGILTPADNPYTSAKVAKSKMREPLIKLEGASHVTIEGLVLEHCQGDGIHITRGSDIRLAGLKVRNIGNTGVVIDGGTHHAVLSCDIYQVAATGIEVSGGDRRQLTRCNHEIVNNHVHHFATRIERHGSGIRVGGVGIRVENNHIHNSPNTAIRLSGNDHLIEKNHIHDVCQKTGDSGALYMGQDWTERGNIIQYNLIHDTSQIDDQRDHGRVSRAVYLDDCASGTITHGNIFYDCTMAVFIGGGRSHHVTNNIFVGCNPALVIDGRGLDKKDHFKRMVDETMRHRFEAMNPLEPPYANRYPDLKELAAYYFHATGVPPEGNLVSRNICVGDWIEVREPAVIKMIAIQNNFTDGDPGFANLANRDFHLDESAEVLEFGFKPIPLEKIGLFQNRYRV
ncbi:MAG: right-handed parallel beta-helix repeat-containing protein [Candidatus Latescibacterota bacterium]|nr:right-handed parallel beta-helix repeat-containing protein [Candidatus Latescibacterota bacterium]